MGSLRASDSGLYVNFGDELHAQPNRELYDVLKTSTGSRRQPLFVMFTTAGYDKSSICWEEHEYATRLLTGATQDDTYLPIIYAAGHDEDWTDPKVWARANPGLGESVKVVAFTAAVSAAACVLAGLVPALHALRTGAIPALKEVRARGANRLGKGLVVAQLSISMVLLVGAALFIGSLVKLYTVARGFDPDGVLVVNVRAAQPYPASRAGG